MVFKGMRYFAGISGAWKGKDGRGVKNCKDRNH